MIRKSIYVGWIISALFLFLYSFTQVDLGLTLTRISIWQTIQRSFQYIGYFQRPLSSALFASIIIILFLLYIATLKFTLDGKLKRADIWKIILTVGIILTLSYNAFSYDLFNYIFDARIVTHYGQNPYFQKALDYPGDPMLSFMQWTHRLYPYGPVWLILTIPLSFIGSNIFLLTFFLFKFFLTGCYLGSAYLVYLINKKILPEYKDFNLVLFALNPLVIIESLVSSHNDIVMVLFALLGLYLFFFGKKILAIISVTLSAMIK